MERNSRLFATMSMCGAGKSEPSHLRIKAGTRAGNIEGRIRAAASRHRRERGLDLLAKGRVVDPAVPLQVAPRDPLAVIVAVGKRVPIA